VRLRIVALGVFGLLVGACGNKTPPPAPAPFVEPVGPPARSAAVPALPRTPAPSDLTDVASRFGLTMAGDGWSWTPMDEKRTRFQWSGKTAKPDRELLYSFWMPKLGETEAKFLPQLVVSAAMNLAEGRPCAAFEQPREIVEALGFDRVITVCFVPTSVYARGFTHGVMHGLVKKEALTIAVILCDSPAAAVPTSSMIGAEARR
jgi:hypothetical protein